MTKRRDAKRERLLLAKLKAHLKKEKAEKRKRKKRNVLRQLSNLDRTSMN